MFAPSERAARLLVTMETFLEDYIYPAEATLLADHVEPDVLRPQSELMELLKARARELGLWNLFLPHAEEGHGR